MAAGGGWGGTENNKHRMAKLTEQEKIANSIFALKMFEQLKDNGSWVGDSFVFKKVNNKFYAIDKESWKYAQKTLSALLLLSIFDISSPIYKPVAKVSTK